MMQRNIKAARQGFTLVELLVVIAIVAILASLVLPSLQSAREKGRQSVCVNNLRQISGAVLSYSFDNDGRFPTSYSLDPVLNRYYAVLSVQGYLPMRDLMAFGPPFTRDKPPSVYICPTDYSLHYYTSHGIHPGWLYYAGYRGSYGPNRQLMPPYAGEIRNGRLVDFVHVSLVARPALTAMFAESAVNRPSQSQQSNINFRDFSELNLPERFKHDGMLHIGFADGSVRGVKEPISPAEILIDP